MPLSRRQDRPRPPPATTAAVNADAALGPSAMNRRDTDATANSEIERHGRPPVEHFVALHSRRLARAIKGVDLQGLDALTRLDLPGNVRELSLIIERAILLCDPGGWLTAAELFDELTDARTLDPARSLEEDVTRFERERIRLALDRCDGNRTHAARELGITYRGLLKKMQRLGFPTRGRR